MPWSQLKELEEFVAGKTELEVRHFGKYMEERLSSLDVAKEKTDKEAWTLTCLLLVQLILARRRLSGQSMFLLHHVPEHDQGNLTRSPCLLF